VLRSSVSTTLKKLYPFCTRKVPLPDVRKFFNFKFLDIPTADEIFEGDKYTDKIWILLRTIFDVFAMHDVGLLLLKIVKWINKSLSYFPGRE